MKLAFEGILKKPQRKEKYWGVGVPLLEIYSQGKSQKDALAMIKDAVENAVSEKSFKVEVQMTGDDTFALSASDFGVLLAFMLKQKRIAKDLSFREVSEKLGSSSPNAYSRYEHRDSGMSLEKLLELVGAVSDDEYLLLKTG
jgi:predicted RNase H-like HicB family nuclease